MDGRKASVRKTYQNLTEANDKVWSLNQETGKASETLAIFYERFEQVNCRFSDVDKKCDTEFEEMEQAMEKAKEAEQFADITLQATSGTHVHHRRLATSFDEAEVALNEGLGCTHKLITATARATSSMSNGTGDCTENEQDCLQKSLALLTNRFNEEGREGYELVTAESS